MSLTQNTIFRKNSTSPTETHGTSHLTRIVLRHFDYLENFNIIPTGLDKDRPLFFKEMIRNITLFKDLYNTWAQNVNEVAQRKIDQYNLNAIKKRTFKPVEPKFLNNFRTLTSKFI